MRTNLPITNCQVVLSDVETIVSTTDLQGKITYANPYFIEVSGYSKEELVGAPQNILRHPDMPAEAFADLWASIKQGQAWTGMVKNRCKNGDFYWVVANVTPIFENGQAVGYMSVRTKPNQAQIANADALYKKIKAGNPEKIQIQQGTALSQNWFAALKRKTSMSLQNRITCNLSLMLLIFLALFVLPLSEQFGTAHHSSWQLTLAAIGAISAAWFWYSLYFGLVRPLKQAQQACQIMAGGDLTLEIRTERRDEVGQLLRTLRQLRVNLHSIVRDVRHNFEHIALATTEIAAGNNDLSSRTEAQASALEETASSMEELASTVQQNSDNAGGANDMASAAAQVAGEGGKNVADMVHTMSDIGSSSKRIVDIITIIEGIAFQTNILALNAAVEAARAGEQGRGFAVVATEVRNLAQRSASAAKEISQLIAASVNKVDAGVRQAEKAGATMNDIIQSVDKVSSIMAEIASASHQQSSGIAQVNQAITQMDEVTQQNAALVEQAAAAANSLQDQTTMVMQSLTVFKLDHAVAKTILQVHSGVTPVLQKIPQQRRLA